MSGAGSTWHRFVEHTRETQWVLPVLGAIGGLLLALALGLTEALPGTINWTLTVSDGRGVLLSWLSILFAAFSIILALATLTIQNVIGKYSMRMYRLYQREHRDRYVLALFAMTATYIVTEQILLRNAAPEDPVPAIGFIVAFILLVTTGISLIWYISTTARWFRVDWVCRAITERLLDDVDASGPDGHGTMPAPKGAFERPPEAVPIRVRQSGHLIEPDPLEVLAVMPDQGATAVIARLSGSPVVSGEEIGWLIDADASGRDAAADRVGRVVEAESARSVAGSISYSVGVLVDIAIMALSPAVNDPNTAVQVLDEMTFLFEGLSQREMGSHETRLSGSDNSVVVRSMSFADCLELGTEQILFYGRDDTRVVAALEGMARSLSSLDLTEADRAAVEDLQARVAAIGSER